MKHETKHTETTVHFAFDFGGVIVILVVAAAGVFLGWVIWG